MAQLIGYEKKRGVLLICLHLLVLLLTGWGVGYAQESPDFLDNQGYLAIFYPLKSATLSAEVGGTVTAINYDMGEAFKKNDALIVLDAEYLQAEKEKAEATRDYYASAYRSKRKLYQQKSVSSIEYAKSQADYHVSKADFAIAKKRVDACTIRAPFNGKVVKHLVQENEFVTEGQPLLEIIDDSIIRVKFHLPSAIYRQLAVGQIFKVRIKNLPALYDCKITHISPVVESNTSSFQVFGEIDNAKNTIRAGMTGFIQVGSQRNE